MSFSFSFLLPTRGRPALAQRFLQSIVDTAAHLETIEVILAVDDDDPASLAIRHDRLKIETVVMAKGATMGALNRACFEASSGRYVMLINDDVVIRTPNWDRMVAATFARYPDDIALIHVNDLLFRERLCTFPMLSRKGCQAIGLCPAEYRRYRIDDHIYDTYNMLAHLGHKRIIYLEAVIFEHENFEEGLSRQEKNSSTQRFESSDKKVYVPNQAIIEQDAAFFERTLARRKQEALSLASLIDQHRAQDQQALYHQLLSAVQDSYSYRRDGYVTRVTTTGPEAGGAALGTVTIALVTSDIYKPHAKKSLALLKKHTSNFDLIILDNNNSSDFNHPREMNKVLQTVQTDYLILMDDDVFVEPGWLEGMLATIDDETGIVTPLHKDKRGRFSYSGVYLKGDGLGSHAHTLDRPDQARPTQCICSAVVLIDMKKCGHIRFNPAYRKYFLDLDYSLKVWEAGYRVVCTPGAMVTHIGGGTMAYHLPQSQSLNQQDALTFVDIWVKPGRLAHIETNIWSNIEYLAFLTTLPQKIADLFDTAETLELDQFKQAVEKMLETIGPHSLFRDLMADHAYRYGMRCRLKGDLVRAHYCDDQIDKLVPKPVYVKVLGPVVKPVLRPGIRLIKSNPYSRAVASAGMGMLKVMFQRYQRFPASIRNVTDLPVLRFKYALERVIRWQQAQNSENEIPIPQIFRRRQ